MRFFDSLYFDLYSSSRKSNGAPEIPVLGFISFCQTNNILTLLNISFYTLDFNSNYQIHKYYLILQIILFMVNLYYYDIRKNGNIILKNENNSMEIKPYISYLYLISSILLTGFTYYILREF